MATEVEFHTAYVDSELLAGIGNKCLKVIFESNSLITTNEENSNSTQLFVKLEDDLQRLSFARQYSCGHRLKIFASSGYKVSCVRISAAWEIELLSRRLTKLINEPWLLLAI